MTAQEIVKQIKPLGNESYRKTLSRHGVAGKVFGVKIEELKKIQKKVKKDYKLALDLYDTGIYDAMYLAGLIADDAKMTKADLRRWAKKSTSHATSQYTVAWVAAESAHGRELALEWIESADEKIASSGWATLASLVSIKDDAELDLGELKKLLARVEKTIHKAPNWVRYNMNSFVIALGCMVKGLTREAKQAAEKIGPVTVDMGDTACVVPSARMYIEKVEQRGSLGKKRATARC